MMLLAPLVALLAVTTAKDLPPKILHEFSNPTWLENIAIRSNSQLLTTLIAPAPILYQVDPSTSNATPKAIFDFTSENKKGLLGITEGLSDQFYIIASNVSLVPVDFAPGTGSVYNVDLTSATPKVKKVVDIPLADFANGIATLSVTQGLAIFADSLKGVIWLLNTNTGAYRVLLDEPEMKYPAGAALPLGVNGVKISSSSKGKSKRDKGKDGGDDKGKDDGKGNDDGKGKNDDKNKDVVYIYFSNTAAALFCRVPFSLSTLTKTGNVEVLASGHQLDDFDLDEDRGFAYLSAGGENSILRVPLAGGPVVKVLGGQNDTLVAGPTAVVVAKDIAYVVTNGGLLAPVNGLTTGGRVVSFSTKDS